MRPATLFLILTIFFGSCIKQPSYPPEPEIEFKSVSATQIVPGTDSLVVEIGFQDGDGDLGVKDGDSTLNAFLIDNRTGFPYSYQIPFVNPRGNSKSISGTIWITVDPFALNCRPNRPNFDTISYEVYIVDRAGNESNRVQTPDIILDCP